MFIEILESAVSPELAVMHSFDGNFYIAQKNEQLIGDPKKIHYCIRFSAEGNIFLERLRTIIIAHEATPIQSPITPLKNTDGLVSYGPKVNRTRVKSHILYQEQFSLHDPESYQLFLDHIPQYRVEYKTAIYKHGYYAMSWISINRSFRLEQCDFSTWY